MLGLSYPVEFTILFLLILQCSFTLVVRPLAARMCGSCVDSGYRAENAAYN